MPPPPTAASPPAPSPPSPPTNDTVEQPALYTLPTNRCAQSCVPFVDSSGASTLLWCSSLDGMTKFGYCDLTGTTDAPGLEHVAIQTYLSLTSNMTLLTDACKVLLHKWVCLLVRRCALYPGRLALTPPQFFPMCVGTTQALLPICQTSCQALVVECGFSWLDCGVEVEEMRGDAPAWWFDAGGSYIRGVKPINASVPVDARRSVQLGVDGVEGAGLVFGQPPLCVSPAARAAASWLLLLLVSLLLTLE